MRRFDRPLSPLVDWQWPSWRDPSFLRKQVERLREMAEDSEALALFHKQSCQSSNTIRAQADELLQQTHDTIDSCTGTTLIAVTGHVYAIVAGCVAVASVPPCRAQHVAGTPREPSSPVCWKRAKVATSGSSAARGHSQLTLRPEAARFHFHPSTKNSPTHRFYRAFGQQRARELNVPSLADRTKKLVWRAWV